MVEGHIEAELTQVGDLVRATGDADGGGSLDLRDLPDDGSDGAGRSGHGHGLTLLGLTDLEQTRVRSEPGHSEHTEVGGDRRELRVDLRRCPVDSTGYSANRRTEHDSPMAVLGIDSTTSTRWLRP